MMGTFEGPLQPVLQKIFGEGLFLEKAVVLDLQDESVIVPILREVGEAHPTVYIKSRAKTFGPEVKLRVTCPDDLAR